MVSRYFLHCCSLLFQVDFVLQVLTLLSCKGAMTAGKYTIVAQVIDGMDVLDKMEKIKVGKLSLLVVVDDVQMSA